MDARVPRSPEGKIRLLLGFAVVPPVTALAAVALYPLLLAAGFFSHVGRVHVGPDVLRSLAFGVGILALLVTVLAALPAVLWFAARGPLRRRRLLLLGVALGNLPLLLIVVVATIVNLAAGTLERGRTLYEIPDTIARVLLGAACGISGAAVFWAVGVRGTDLDAARPRALPPDGPSSPGVVPLVPVSAYNLRTYEDRDPRRNGQAAVGEGSPRAQPEEGSGAPRPLHHHLRT